MVPGLEAALREQDANGKLDVSQDDLLAKMMVG